MMRPFPMPLLKSTLWKRGIEGDFSRLSLRGGRKADAAICAPAFFLLAILFPSQPVPESSNKPRHRGEPKPRAQRGGQRGDLAISMRLPRTLRVLAMTRSNGVSASYRWIREKDNLQPWWK